MLKSIQIKMAPQSKTIIVCDAVVSAIVSDLHLRGTSAGCSVNPGRGFETEIYVWRPF
jgi:hypothetical protein